MLGRIRLNISHELSTHEIFSLIWLLLKNKFLKCFLLIFIGDLWVETYSTKDSEVEITYSKTCLKRPLKKDQKLVFKTGYRLMLNYKNLLV